MMLAAGAGDGDEYCHVRYQIAPPGAKAFGSQLEKSAAPVICVVCPRTTRAAVPGTNNRRQRAACYRAGCVLNKRRVSSAPACVLGRPESHPRSDSSQNKRESGHQTTFCLRTALTEPTATRDRTRTSAAPQPLTFINRLCHPTPALREALLRALARKDRVGDFARTRGARWRQTPRGS